MVQRNVRHRTEVYSAILHRLVELKTLVWVYGVLFINWSHDMRQLRIAVFLITSLIFVETAGATSKNGFTLDGASIPLHEILSGGPGKDGIPAIDDPKFVQPKQATFLSDSDRILGLEIDGQAKAYPINILDWHEVVNDNINDTYFAVTFCPLCGTGLAFHTPGADSVDRSFGVSGLLYQSDVLLYDRATDSLWSQLLGKAVTGDRLGESLTPIPVFHTSWEYWLKSYPNTLVLGTDTGFRRNYRQSPYAGYAESPRLYFEVSANAPDTYHPKEQVLGVEVDGEFRAYAFSELEKQGLESFPDSLNGLEFDVNWNREAHSAYVSRGDDTPMHTITAFWFAWYAFHPDTEVFTAK